MTIKANQPPKQGTETAAEIYACLGLSVSWWEASEDMLMGVFRQLCAVQEPVAFEAYVASPRNRRSEMLKAAIKRYGETKLQGNESEKLLGVMKALDKLAAVRNEIEHGHCSQTNSTKDGEVIMSGHYLLPSLNEQGWHERSHRYAPTAETMHEFIAAVRHHRGIVLDIYNALFKRYCVAQEAEMMAKHGSARRQPPLRLPE